MGFKGTSQDVNLLIFIHRYYLDGKIKKGGFDRAIEYFISNKENICLVQGDLEGVEDILIEFYLEGHLAYTKKNKKKFKNSPLIWIDEVIKALRFSWSISGVKIIIAVDPLNFISCYLIKKIRFNSAKLYFHAIDYSDKRFNSKILNFIYLKIYKFALINADTVTVVSSAMLKKFLELHPSGIYEYLPNSPEIKKFKNIKYFQKVSNSIVLSSVLYYGVDYRKIINGAKLLKLRGFTFKFLIVGDGPIKEDFMAEVLKADLPEHFIFYGHLSYEEAILVVRKSYIGLALYSGSALFNFYGDSIKIREYAACALPIIADGVTSTAIEAQSIGCCTIVSTAEELSRAIEDLLFNEKKYKEASKNSYKWAVMNDKESLIKRIYYGL